VVLYQRLDYGVASARLSSIYIETIINTLVPHSTIIQSRAKYGGIVSDDADKWSTPWHRETDDVWYRTLGMAEYDVASRRASKLRIHRKSN
jgi:hypothetical protein